MASLQVKVSQKKSGETVSYEGTVTLPGLAPTKLVRKSDQSSRFGSQSALRTAARNLATNLGFTEVEMQAPATSKKAAKTSASA